jgi:hypothetical protein
MASTALVAEGASRLVDLEGLQGALVEAERARRAGGDAAAAGDAVGELERLAVGCVDLDAEAAPAEVVAGGPGHLGADAHAAPAGDALVHVAVDERMPLVGLLAAHDAGHGRPGVVHHELVLGDVVLDPEALQLAAAVGVARALQAAGGLGAGRGRRKALVDLVERVEPPGRRQRPPPGARGALGGDAHREPDGAALGQPLAELAELVRVAHLLEIGQAAVEGQLRLQLREVGAREPGVDGQGGALGRRDGVDGRLGAGDRVAGGEHAVLRGTAGEGVGLERVPG